MSDLPTRAQMEAFVEAGYAVADIATDQGWSVSKVRYWLKKFDLKASKASKSVGHKAFRAILVKHFPSYPIEEEYHLGQRLRLDFYIPNLYVGFEIDGRQHEKIDDLFHSGSWREFKKQVQRDEDKEHLCKNQGILMIRVPASLAEKACQDPKVATWLMKDIINRVAEHEPPPKVVENGEPPSPRYSAYRERMKDLGRKVRKENYRRAKALKEKLRKRDAKKALSE